MAGGPEFPSEGFHAPAVLLAEGLTDEGGEAGDRLRPVPVGDSCAGVAMVDRDGERRGDRVVRRARRKRLRQDGMPGRGLSKELREERQSDSFAGLRGDRCADEPARVLPEEADDVRGHELGSDDNVRLFFATVRIVHEDGAAAPKRIEGARDGFLHADVQRQDAY